MKYTPISSLAAREVGVTRTFVGWIHRVRDHGGLLFIDLRDHYGIMQCALDADNTNISSLAKVREESVVAVTGLVKKRPEGTENPNLFTGSVEVVVESFEVLNEADVLPFTLHDEDFTAGLEHRLKYRYLDLRREKMQNMLRVRSDALYLLRTLMREHAFDEIQTPILTASSPEGARDYLVPSRLHPGKFYALPQAPQIFKQLLMVSGVRRYFQIAPCFRDEAGRSDRSPGEFYQLDMEFSFPTQDEIFKTVEDVVGRFFLHFLEKGRHLDHDVALDCSGSTIPTFDWEIETNSIEDDLCEGYFTWERIPYLESMLKYGNDKPDLRCADYMYMRDYTEDFASVDGFLADIVAGGGVVRVLPVAGNEMNLSGKWFKDMDGYAKDLGMAGLGYFKSTDDGFAGPLFKFIGQELAEKIANDVAADWDTPLDNCSYIVIAGDKADVQRWSSDIRVEVAKRSGNHKREQFKFCWIVDFPMYELNEDTGQIEFSHNPFSMPQGGMDDLENKDPLDILAWQYDLVCNGIEISSGAIRNHRVDIMEKAFEIAGYDKEVVHDKFPSLINAFKFGAPPHGGIAPGFDRMLMLLLDEENIREVIAFPMNGQAQDLMMNAPSEVTPEQLKELGIRIPKKVEDGSK